MYGSNFNLDGVKCMLILLLINFYLSFNVPLKETVSLTLKEQKLIFRIELECAMATTNSMVI